MILIKNHQLDRFYENERDPGGNQYRISEGHLCDGTFREQRKEILKISGKILEGTNKRTLEGSVNCKTWKQVGKNCGKILILEGI